MCDSAAYSNDSRTHSNSSSCLLIGLMQISLTAAAFQLISAGHSRWRCVCGAAKLQPKQQQQQKQLSADVSGQTALITHRGELSILLVIDRLRVTVVYCLLSG